MQRMNLSSFDEYTTSQGLTSFVYDSTNQIVQPTRAMVIQTYNELHISLKPDVMVFKKGRDILAIREPSCVLVGGRTGGGGIAIQVVQKPNRKEESETKYTFIAYK